MANRKKSRTDNAHALALVKDFRAIVARKHLTHENAARESGFNLNTVGRWLRGEHLPKNRQMQDALEKFNLQHTGPVVA